MHILYRGPSALDGKEIVCIATGTNTPIQKPENKTYDSDLHPTCGHGSQGREQIRRRLLDLRRLHAQARFLLRAGGTGSAPGLSELSSRQVQGGKVEPSRGGSGGPSWSLWRSRRNSFRNLESTSLQSLWMAGVYSSMEPPEDGPTLEVFLSSIGRDPAASGRR